MVEYYIDGYEDISLDNLSAEWFDGTAYQRQNLRTNELVSSGDPVYKLITDENWKLVFPLDTEMEQYILDKIQANQKTAEDGTVTQRTTYIQIRFDKDEETAWPFCDCGISGRTGLRRAFLCEFHGALRG